jgi:7-cyano-7-deazaguanine synthase in queuosine biosynthesis
MPSKAEWKLAEVLDQVMKDTCALHDHVGRCPACDRRTEALWNALYDNRKTVIKAMRDSEDGSKFADG